MAGLTVQQILHEGDAAFAGCHPLPAYVRKAAWALLGCRTAVLGGHIQACPEGHVERVWDHACRHRLCPPCAWLQVERWLVQQKTRLRPCDHDHVMCTIPSALQDLWLVNVAARTPWLCASVHATWLEWLGDPHDLGATPGILATWHTWTQTRRLHPPIHALVTGGGLTRTGQWVAVHHGFWLPSRVVMARCRGTWLAAVRRAVRQGQVQRPAGMRPQRWENLLHKLGGAKWHVHIRERYPHGVGVLTYLARYVRGGPLANRRLVSCAQGEVTFRYRVNGEAADGPRRGLMTWSVADFIGRYRLHVPAPGTRVVRAYGLYAPTQGEA